MQKLSGLERYKLNKWVEESVTQRPELFKGNTFAGIAAVATGTLGFHVTPSHIRSARDFTGVEWEGKHRGNGHRHFTMAQARMMWAAIEGLANKGGLRFDPGFKEAMFRVPKKGQEANLDAQAFFLFESPPGDDVVPPYHLGGVEPGEGQQG